MNNSSNLTKLMNKAISQLEEFTKTKLPPKAKLAAKQAIGKVLVARGTSEALDAMHLSDIFQKVYDWSTDATRFLMENTVGKIPVIGKMFIEGQKLGNKINRVLETVITGKPRTKTWNDKEFYLHLDEHVNFVINQGYKKRAYRLGTASVPEVASIQLALNPVPSADDLNSRMIQLFQLLKGVRGLSSTSYDKNQVTAYTINTATLFAIYFSTVKLIRCAQTYSFRNVAWPRQLVAAMGFDIDEVSENLADYIQLALLMQRQLRITTPSTGVFRDVIKTYALKTLCDTRSPKIATMYIYNFSKLPYFADSGSNTSVSTIQFFYPNAGNDIAALRDIFKSAKSFENDAQFADIAADMIGAFGKSSIYELNMDFNKLNDKPLDAPKYDELALNTLKNGTICSHSVNVNNADGHDTADVYAQVINGAISTNLPTVGTVLAGNWILVQTSFIPVAPSVAINFDLFIRPDGTAIADTPFAEDEYNTAATYYTVHKDKLDEGESLELSLLKTRVYSYVKRTAVATPVVGIQTTIALRTNYLSIHNIWTYDDQSGGRYLNHITEESTAANTADGDAILTRTTQIWSLCDWMPQLYLGIYEEGAQQVNARSSLWDVDDIGLLDSHRAQDNSLELTTYSFYAPDLKASGKKIDNIQDVYNE